MLTSPNCSPSVVCLLLFWHKHFKFFFSLYKSLLWICKQLFLYLVFSNSHALSRWCCSSLQEASLPPTPKHLQARLEITVRCVILLKNFREENFIFYFFYSVAAKYCQMQHGVNLQIRVLSCPEKTKKTTNQRCEELCWMRTRWEHSLGWTEASTVFTYSQAWAAWVLLCI